MGKRGPKASGVYSSKGATLSARITAPTRERLEAAAAANDRSISQEVEALLTQALDQTDAFGGPVNFWLFFSLAKCFQTVEQRTGRKWWEDRYTFEECRELLHGAFGRLQPQGRAARPKAKRWGPKGAWKMSDQTPPSAIALNNFVAGLLLFGAARAENLAIPEPYASAVAALTPRIKLTPAEEKEREFLRQNIRSGAMPINFGRTGK